MKLCLRSVDGCLSIAGKTTHVAGLNSLPPSQELLEQWRAALEAVRMTVSERHWMIFQRYLIEDQSSRSVAEEFNTTHFNVRVISHRIRNQVAEHALGCPPDIRDSRDSQGHGAGEFLVAPFKSD